MFSKLSIAKKLIFLKRFKESAEGVIKTLSGTLPLSFTALASNIISLIQHGKTEQEGTPTPSAPIDIYCNNGAIKWGVSGTNLLDMAEGNIRLRYYINDSGAETSNTQNFYNTKFIPVKPNTAYTLSASEPVYYSSIMEYDSNKSFLQRTLDGSSSEKHASMTITTRADTAYILIGSNPIRAALSMGDVTGIDWMLNEGSTALPYEPYTEGIIAEGTPEVLSVVGLNLFYNDTAWEEGLFITSGKVAAAGSNRTFVMRCTPNTTYYWKHCSLVGGVRAFTVDEDEVAVGVEGKWIKQNPVIGEINEVYSATTGATAKWLCVCFGRNQSSAAPIADQWSDFILSVSPLTEDTPYEPYHNQQTASVQNLYQVGDYADTQDIITGVITRRVGIKVLDGTETWGAKNATTGQVITRVTDMLNQSSAPLIVTHGEWSTSATKDSNKWRVVVGPYLAAFPSQETTADFKAWLAAQYAAGTPVIVMYPLAEEETETVTPQPLKTVQGNNTISAISDISGIKVDITYLGEE